MTFAGGYAIKDGPKGVDSTTAALTPARSELAMAKSNLSIIDRFMQYVSPEPNSGCWLWIAADRGNGYGAFKIGRKQHSTHRVSWILHNGPIPKGWHVCHRCDVRSCVNPEHLFLGTHKDNMSDRNRKERQARGERQGASKLNENQVREILRSSEPQRTIAKKYNISQGAVNSIKVGASWTHLKRVSRGS